jgi:hypothetical protein
MGPETRGNVKKARATSGNGTNRVTSGTDTARIRPAGVDKKTKMTGKKTGANPPAARKSTSKIKATAIEEALEGEPANSGPAIANGTQDQARPPTQNAKIKKARAAPRKNPKDQSQKPSINPDPKFPPRTRLRRVPQVHESINAEARVDRDAIYADTKTRINAANAAWRRRGSITSDDRHLELEAVIARRSAQHVSNAFSGPAMLPELLTDQDVEEYYARQEALRVERFAREKGLPKKRKVEEPEAVSEARSSRKRKERDDDQEHSSTEIAQSKPPSKRARTSSAQSAIGAAAEDAGDPNNTNAVNTAEVVAQTEAVPEPKVTGKRKNRSDEDDLSTVPAQNTRAKRAKTSHKPNAMTNSIEEASKPNSSTAGVTSKDVDSADAPARTTTAQPTGDQPLHEKRVLCGVEGCSGSNNTMSELRGHYKKCHPGVPVPETKEEVPSANYIEWLNDEVKGYPVTMQAKKKYAHLLRSREAPAPSEAAPETPAQDQNAKSLNPVPEPAVEPRELLGTLPALLDDYQAPTSQGDCRHR